ncbi:MAG: M48 family metallopeptidase [Leptolyngbya sp. SIO4C1]|nr:M48 family metallopeptidase [Leptolyngbya sp. SIO4C1]
MPTYPGISSAAFRHPLDRQAEAALRSVPGFDLVARKFVEFMYERPQMVYLMGNSLQAGPQQYATLYGCFQEAVAALDMQPEPTLFVSQNPIANSYALGEDKPCIVATSGLLDLLDVDELHIVMAHELGHIKCGHTTLIQMALWAMNAASVLGDMTLGIGNLVSSSLIYAFYEWRRKAELTSDRAALLASDDVDAVIRTMMKLAGGSQRYAHEVSLDAFVKQSERYHSLDDDGLNQVYKFILYNGTGAGPMLTHPFPAERLSYLRDWAASEEYRQIKQGNYARQNTPTEDIIDAEPVETAASEVETLRAELAALQREIEALRREQ